jgi:hypothetical protein
MAMSEQQKIAIVESIYSAFDRGDVEFILSQLTDDIRWTSHLEPIVPWGGDFSGKRSVPLFFQAIRESVDVEEFEPMEWIAQGDTLVSIGRFVCRVRSTGKTANTRWAFIWKIRDGKVYSYEQFHDPALAVAFRRGD